MDIYPRSLSNVPLVFQKGREEDQRTSFVATLDKHTMTETYPSRRNVKPLAKWQNQRFLSHRGKTPRVWRLKVNVVKEEGVVVRARERCQRSAAATYRPRGLEGYRRRRLLWLSQSETARSLSPLSQVATQQVHRAKWDSLRARRESGDHQMKVYLRRLRPPRRVFHAFFFFFFLFSVSIPTPAPLQPFLECWEWFTVTKKVKSIYGKWASLFKLISYSRTLLLFHYKNNI